MEDPEKLFELSSDIWQSCMDRKDFHGAILAGVSLYTLLWAQGSEQLARGALGYVHVAIESAERPAGHGKDEINCSFCGRREPEVKLAAGPNAHICNKCVETLGQTFNKE